MSNTDNSASTEPSTTPNEQDALRLIDYLLDHGGGEFPGPVLLALPFPLSEESLRSLLEKPRINGIMCGDGIDDCDAISHFHPDDWEWGMPKQSAPTILCAGSKKLFSFRMFLAAHRHKVKQVVYLTSVSYGNTPVLRFLVIRFFEKIFAEIKNFYQARIAEPLYKISERFIQKTPLGHKVRRLYNIIGSKVFAWRYRSAFERLGCISSKPLLEPSAFIANRIIEVNTSLYHGGAERQIVNTMLGMLERGYDDQILLCESLDPALENDFYQWRLDPTPIKVAEVRTVLGAAEREQLGDEMIARVAEALQGLSPELAETIRCYVCEFLLHRPQVVHIWQDATNVIGGLAAALVGVPTILITLVNMSADRFPHFFRLYYWLGYRVLLEADSVTIINNSNAGNTDYERWLKIGPGQLGLLHNGMEAESLPDIPVAEADAYRQSLGIAADVPVIGSIIRFSPEKDPLLWIRAIKIISDAKPKARFLLIGDGPMRSDMAELADQLGLTDRLLMPGTVTNPALTLAIFDVFMLTSTEEGIPNVVIEAQWVGVPVVSTDAGGTRDALDIGITGWIIESRSAEEIAERVLFVLDNDEWREKACQSSPKMAAQRFGMDRMVDETLQFFKLPLTRRLSENSDRREGATD